jgi:RHS repeat-associated protein
LGGNGSGLAASAPNNHPTITYTYDAAGNQTSITDPAGNTTTTAYDHMNRPTTITDALNHNTTLSYDNAGNLTATTDRNGRQTTYSYDTAGRLTGETWVSGNYTATYAYDAASELTSETDSNSNYSLGYDTAGRLITVDNINTPNAPHVLLTYTYDAADNVTGVSDNTAGPQVTMTPDPYGRLSAIIRQAPGGYKVITNFTYDADNRISYIDQGYNTVGTNSIINQLAQYSYVYDNAGQETGYTGPEGSITLVYDQRGELTGVSGAWSESYSYDLNGNRTMTGYTTSTGNRLTSDGTYNYTFDNEGNLLTKTRISDSQVTNFTWDYRNRLTEVTIKTSGGTTLQDDKFTYDIENRRIAKNTLSGGQSWTAYDGLNPYADFNSSGSLTYRYLYGNAPDFLLARYDGTNTLWYLTDKLGSVRLLVDKSANIQDTISYDSFGNIRSETGTGDRFKFTGREWDSEITLYYYRARYYSATIGRFISQDPLGFKAGDSNTFRYVGNNPTFQGDPTGLGPLAGAATLRGGSPTGSLVAAIEAGDIAQIQFLLKLLAETGVVVSAAVLAAAQAKIIMAQRGKRNISNEIVEAIKRMKHLRTNLEKCVELKGWYQAARMAGDTQRALKIITAMKEFGCR